MRLWVLVVLELMLFYVLRFGIYYKFTIIDKYLIIRMSVSNLGTLRQTEIM